MFVGRPSEIRYINQIDFQRNRLQKTFLQVKTNFHVMNFSIKSLDDQCTKRFQHSYIE